MNVEKEMVKDIEEICPFYDVDFPKTISCSRVEPSKDGYNYYEDETSDADGMLWNYASFEGEFIYAGFTCKLSRRVMGYEIELDDFDITETPSSPKEFETLIKELDFVKQVLSQSDYIKQTLLL